MQYVKQLDRSIRFRKALNFAGEVKSTSIGNLFRRFMTRRAKNNNNARCGLTVQQIAEWVRDEAP